ncbi:MAG: twin-arginine translocation signal domain-containing protein [Candidatus Dojkabacteria bacterium]|jgi:hypothetical protein|nr:twin-arginine translocation signal domain-containing protein [Candidatus Dojkabacteria bacterium]
MGDIKNVDIQTDYTTESEKSDEMIVQSVVSEIGEKINSMPPVSRRNFMKIAATTTLAGVLAACNVNIEDADIGQESKLPTPVEPVPTEKPLEGIEKEYEERGITLVKDPLVVEPRFVKGVTGFSTAIAEGFPFPPIDGSGKEYILKYGKDFEEVTYMHYTGEIPPVVGEILPLAYRLPEKAKEKEIEVVAYAISVPTNVSKKVEFTNDSEHYLMPIVTSGSNSGITPTTSEGKIVNSSYPPFEVVADSVSQNRNGYLSWVLLTKMGDQIVVEGIVNNSSAKLYIDFKNAPKEVLSVYGL